MNEISPMTSAEGRVLPTDVTLFEVLGITIENLSEVGDALEENTLLSLGGVSKTLPFHGRS